MNYKRLLALDYGDVRIGIAMSDLMQIIASPYETYKRQTLIKDLEYISNLIKTNLVHTVVIGLPLNMDGSEGERTKKTKEFADALGEKTDAKIVFFDERLTSVTAEDILIEAGVKREERKKIIDKLAATIILKSYMDSIK